MLPGSFCTPQCACPFPICMSAAGCFTRSAGGSSPAELILRRSAPVLSLRAHPRCFSITFWGDDFSFRPPLYAASPSPRSACTNYPLTV